MISQLKKGEKEEMDEGYFENCFLAQSKTIFDLEKESKKVAKKKAHVGFKVTSEERN